jgi:hypothetical protein
MVMPTDNPSGRDDSGYVAEDAALASAGEPESLKAGRRGAEQPPTAEELDAREARIGTRKPMGPGIDAGAETIPEELPEEPEEKKPSSAKRKRGK